MTGWLVGIGVPVAGFLALIGSVWHHRGRHTGRHVAPTGVLARDVTLPVTHLTVPIAHVKDAPPWDDAPEPDETWVGELRAALDEVQPSGWLARVGDVTSWGDRPLSQSEADAINQDPELYNWPGILAAPTEPARYGVQFDEQGREVGWLPDPHDMWGAPPELAHETPELTRLADTTDQLRLDLAMDVAGYMVEQDADATRYGEDLAGWCAGQLRALRETLCIGR